MASVSDFSTNRHSGSSRSLGTSPARHVDLYFSDGNIVILAGSDYFLVHQGLLSRHSEVLEELIKQMDSTPGIEGRPVLSLPEPSHSIAHFLQALYDGISFLTYDEPGFETVAGLLRVLTTYKVQHIRNDILRVLSTSWPTILTQWESRECSVTSLEGVYSPRPTFPHPIEVIKLARDMNAPSLLPPAMYDLSRCTASEAAIGHFKTSVGDYVTLDESDLLCVLRGREHASRYFSTFIVNELEGRAPSTWCLRRNEPNLVAKRACQIAFEAITFELLRDINGIISNRTSDPLYAMTDAELMQTREGTSDENPSPMRTCEICRTEFSSAVEAAKEDFWRKLPGWFGVEVPNFTYRGCMRAPLSVTADMSNACSGPDPQFGHISCGSDTKFPSCNRNSETIERIENLTLTILEQIVGSLKKPRDNVELSSTASAGRLKHGRVEIRIADRRKEGCGTRLLRFPVQGRSASSKPIAQLLRVMNFAHEALDEDLPLTKRDMYYKDVAIFKSQQTVDRLVDDLAATLELERADLNIRATSKGLICGSSLFIHLIEGETLGLNDSEVRLRQLLE
ncbi:hypothetical protein HYDPIDRAFT_173491 [Hydnomerulius pinastri MD-312]|nr:hypothetical protein HYDPIDRAFT_173491 [Hydnomerulius pinastri MD-312]